MYRRTASTLDWLTENAAFPCFALSGLGNNCGTTNPGRCPGLVCCCPVGAQNCAALVNRLAFISEILIRIGPRGAVSASPTTAALPRISMCHLLAALSKSTTTIYVRSFRGTRSEERRVGKE